jgi:hypothetical protein
MKENLKAYMSNRTRNVSHFEKPKVGEEEIPPDKNIKANNLSREKYAKRNK